MNRRRLCWASVAALICAGGCGSPNAANIVLRKQNQQLSTQVSDLQRQNGGLEAQLSADESRAGGATTQSLGESRLDALFTVHGLEFGRLTGGYSSDPNGPDRMLKVYVVPTDDQGQMLKAAGSFQVQLFDLAEPDTRLGQWNFSTQQARNDWYGAGYSFLSLYTYVLDCPWQKIPRHASVLARVRFTDELTGRQFTLDKQITIKPPR